ncbi:MAG: accessory factor UbiK family protein [Gammaproteobacteria bacterium]|nr:accessory factor UbiK family protein [Gammaproteobacteria bacterium]
MNKPLFDTILNRFSSTLPPGAGVLREDLESGLRAALHSALDKLELVTREEFEVQAQVLQRSRARLEQLEKTVAALESRLNP